MDETTRNLIVAQQAQLETWRTDITEVGGFIADEVWDVIERETENMTSDGLIWDCSDPIKSSLLMTMSMSFDEACEKWITTRIESLNEPMQAQVGSSWKFSTARNSLDNLRKSLRIRQRMTPKFDQCFEKAKPSFFSLLKRTFTDDLDYVMNDMDKDFQKDAARLQSCFYDMREEITAEIAKMAADLLRRSLYAYQDALQAASHSA